MNNLTGSPFSSLPRPPSVSFWEALNPAERQAFRSRGREISFAAGMTLMNEGESGTHVIVILSGWVKISMGEGGQDRVIAERGPGDLVGELAVIQVRVRYATVVALEAVHGLAMRPDDFADFVNASPEVRRIVINQVSDRLAEESTTAERATGEASFESGQHLITAEGGPVVVYPPGQVVARRVVGSPLAFRRENCTVVQSDVVSFSAGYRNDEDRLTIRKALLEMTVNALGDLGDSCHYEDRGDGILLVAPASIPTADVLRPFHEILPQSLRRHNRTYGPCAQIQLRVASDVGPVASDTLGVQGEAIIRAARLLDAQALRKAIAHDHASLGIVVSPFIYETAISPEGGPIDRDGYVKIHVHVKETSQPAWMKIIDPAALRAACLENWSPVMATAPPGSQRSPGLLGARESSYR
jgi:CRP-like cAMP-binding protein